MIRIVIDTCVLIQTLIKPRAAIRELIEVLWLGKQVQIVTAPELMEELEGVVGREYIRDLISPGEAQVLLDAISQTAEFLPPIRETPSFTRDPKDDKFIACALSENAGLLISEDKDILVLGSVGEVHIVTPYDFVRAAPPWT